MLLAVDIGNSSIKFGLFEGKDLASRFSIPTKRDYTAAAIGREVGDRLDPGIRSAIVCSVAPTANGPLREFIKRGLDLDAIFVDSTADLGFKTNYEPKASLGSDRLVNAYAAVAKYGSPCIVCSLGTATTVDAISTEREFLGGAIAPGLNAMANALHLAAEQLPDVEIQTAPARVIGTSTAGAILSGVYYGYIGVVEKLVNVIQAEIREKAPVVATGGLASFIAPQCKVLEIVDETLTLDGLRLIAEASNRS